MLTTFLNEKYNTFKHYNENDNNETNFDISKLYICTKEFKAKEDYQIDLKLNDIVTINQFTGKYILGKKCDTNKEGLFPIYYIERLDGNIIFFRCKKETEYASVNDEIFLIREMESNYYPGYNITRDEQGFFSITNLEPIIMNNETRNKYEALYYKEKYDDNNSSIKNNTSTYSTRNSNISKNIDFSDIEDNLAEPVLPANPRSGNNINIRNSISNNRNSISNNRSSISNSRNSISNNRNSISNNRSSISNSRNSISNNRNSISNSRNSISNNSISNKSISNNRNSINNNRNSINNNRNSINNNRNSICNNRNSISNNSISNNSISNNRNSISNNSNEVFRSEENDNDNYASLHNIYDLYDHNIIKRLLSYYDSLPNEDVFGKSKDNNNLVRMRDAIKKFQELKSGDKRIEMMTNIGENFNEIDGSTSSKIFENLEYLEFENLEKRKEKWEENRYRCEELIETERNYCNKMKIMIDKFKKPLEKAVGTKYEMLNSVQISLIFKNIPDIYRFSSILCEELEEAFTYYDEEGLIPVARVFLNKFSDWKLYIKYVECYKQANKTLENLNESPETNRFNRFMELCQRSEECGRNNLKELIVLPIQRFLKYNIFFKDFRKNTDPRNKDSYDLLDTVENFIFEISEIMNDAKKLQDSIDKMFSLDGIVENFPPDLISFTRRIYIDEWTISEIINKKTKLYLFSDILIFATFLNKKKNKMYKFEKRINILDYNIESTTVGNKKAIKFIRIERNRISEPNTSTSITKKLFYFESEESCNNFIEKYNDLKNILLNK